MTTLRAAAMLLVVNTALLVAGGIGGGVKARWPFWRSTFWIRVGVPLVVAGGLWFGHEWAWWVGVGMTAGLLVWIGVASCVLALGGYFTTAGGAGFHLLHFSVLAATWLAALVLLLTDLRSAH